MKTEKKITALLLTLFISCLVFGQEYKQLTSEGKLRKGRNILTGIVTTVPAGAEVEIIYNSYEKGYYRVIYDIWTGFLHEKHFEPTTTTQKGPYTNMNTVLFREDFNNNKNNWRESKDSNKEYYFSNGAYHIVQKDEGRLTWFAIPSALNAAEDFVIETSVVLHWREGGGAHLMYGVNEEAGNYYSIQIKKEKDKHEVFIGTYKNRKWTGIWKDASISYGKPIRVQIIKKDRMISFYVNGQFMYSQPFEPFFGNAVALGCEGTQHVSYDYLSLQQGSGAVTVEKMEPIREKAVPDTYDQVTQVKLVRTNGANEIPVGLNGALMVYSLFEQGASDITVSRDVAHTLVKSGTIRGMDWLNGQSFEFSDGTEARSDRFRLTAVRIGSKVVHNVTCTVSGYMQVPMILGKNVLQRMGNYSFDNQKGILTIQ